MKIAVFTDIHGNFQALNVILKDIKKRKIDTIISLGDVIGLGPSSNECMNRINDLNIIKIAGNHELYYTKDIDKIHVEKKNAILHNEWIHKHIKCDVDDSKLFYKIKHNNKTFYFTHYFTKDDKYPFESSSIFKTDDYKKVLDRFNYDYVFYGHRHVERTDEYKGNYYYGLGSSGCTKNDNTLYYIINIDDEVKIEKVNLKYDREKFEKEFNKINYPNKEHIGEYFFGIKKC